MLLIEKKNEKILKKVTGDSKKDFLIIKSYYKDIYAIGKNNGSIMHGFTDNLYDEEKCFYVIKALLENGKFNVNYKNSFGANFIQNSISSGYSEDFVLKLIEISSNYSLDVNQADNDGDTIPHFLFTCKKYHGGHERIFEECKKLGFFEMIENKDGQTYSSLLYEYNQRKKNNIVNYKELSKYGTIMNSKEYSEMPIVGRDKELRNLIITLNEEEKSALIIGEPGIGKSSLVDGLIYKIQHDEAGPSLKDRPVLEVSTSSIVSGCTLVGMSEEKMIKIINTCLANNAILFMDEIHTAYRAGAGSENNPNDLASILKYYVDRTNLKIIGTTTIQEYDKYFSGDAFKRRFEVISVKEPEGENLRIIIEKKMNDFCKKTNISFENDTIKNNIINILINSTQKKSRLYYDNVNNPDLSVLIMDKAFAIAKVDGCANITQDHFVESIDLFDRLNSTAKENVIRKLQAMEEIKTSPKVLGKVIPFKKEIM